ncbi:LysR family transcriptional regulator [Pigmentiphaga aceris]|uniref:LysR family transcriptional regulator n=1 Tax=Pigmentiphaga aceris TaxID=1940612 RepID=A0A5C0AWY2_9BURK|nr:LysR family transcriptional regulator [Pigmentiphaga aceris]QEI06838.1 LysR family transcriptional regulator [Pigmentiphaga aceris]
MDLNAVRMFVAIAQTGSLTGAAQRLNIPLPTVSRRLKELERELKVQLVQRAAKGTVLTDAGVRLLEHAAVGIEALQDAEHAVQSDQMSLKGRLRLSLPQTFEPWWKLIASFQNRYPDIEVLVYATERRMDLYEDGIDVALRVGDIRHENLVARKVLSFRNIVVASPALIERLGRPTDPADLRRYPCGVWASRIDARARWSLGDQVIEPRAVIAANDYQMLTQRAIHGDVVAELPPFLALPAIAAGSLVAILEAYPCPEWPVHLLYPQSRFRSNLVRTYLEYCQLNIGEVQAACNHRIWC